MIDFLFDFIFSVIPYLRRRKERGKEWTGFLEEVRKVPCGPLAKYKNRAVFHTDDGRRITIRLTEHDAAKYQRGIRYHKKAGEDFPAPLP
jgi:hypothetical protein